MSQKYSKPLNDTNTLSFYVPYKEGCKSVILNRLKYNDSFFNIDYLNNYFAFLTKESITNEGGGESIGKIKGSNINTYQYILTIIRIQPGYYKDSEELIKVINKNYAESGLNEDEIKERKATPLIGYKEEGGTEYIENINENDKVIYFTKDIIPVNIKLSVSLAEIDELYTNIYGNKLISYKSIKESTTFDIINNNLIFDKTIDNNQDITFFANFLSYNNNSYNPNISLGNYLTDIGYIVNLSSNYCIPMRKGSYMCSFCYMSNTIKDTNDADISIYAINFAKEYSSRKKLELKNIIEMNIKYTYKNNINSLLSNNVNSFNTIMSNANISSQTRTILNINKNINMSKYGVYVYCDCSDKVTQILTSNYCFLYYTYVE